MTSNRCLICESPIEGEGEICLECSDAIEEEVETEDTARDVVDELAHARERKVAEGFRILKGHGE